METKHKFKSGDKVRFKDKISTFESILADLS